MQPGQTVKHLFPDGYSAHWVRLKTDTAATASATFTYGAAAPQIAGAATLPNGHCQVTFAGSPGQAFTLRASADLTQPLANWSALTNGAFGSSPVIYEDTDAANPARRFYIISMP